MKVGGAMTTKIEGKNQMKNSKVMMMNRVGIYQTKNRKFWICSLIVL